MPIRFLITAALLLFLAGAVQVPKKKKPVMQEPVGGFTNNIAGNWSCGRFGIMRLEQNGDMVKGTYTFFTGVIKGRVKEKTFIASWEQRMNNRRGDAEFALSIERKSPHPTHMRGKWRYEGDRAWLKVPWNCEKQ